MDIDELRGSGMICVEGPLLRAGTHGDWCFVIESEGPSLSGEAIVRSVSLGMVALSACKVESGSGDPDGVLRKIQYGLGCAVPQEADVPRLLALRIPGGY